MRRIRLKNIITESVTLSISGASQEYPELDTIGSLTWELTRKVLDLDLFKKFTPQEVEQFKKSRPSEILAADGDDYFKSTGIMNFYTAGWPQRLLKETIQKILDHLDLLGIRVGPLTHERSKVYNSPVIRIPILENQNSKDENPPELNMTNRNFVVLFHNILKLVGDEDYSISISIDELEKAIAHLTKGSDASQIQQLGQFEIPQTIDNGNGGATFIHGGLTTEQLSNYIHTLVQMIRWARAKGYKNISGA